MMRCKVCKSSNDVRSDGICGGCYDALCAASMGMSYGKYIARYGHNYMRGIREKKPLRLCPVCGMVIARSHRGAKYCSDVCRSRARQAACQVDRPKNRSTCRGCRWYIPGSARCVNKNSPMFETALNKGCTKFDRYEVKHG